MLCLSGFELYSLWVPLLFVMIKNSISACKLIVEIVFYRISSPKRPSPSKRPHASSLYQISAPSNKRPPPLPLTDLELTKTLIN